MKDRREEWKEYRRTHPDKTNLERQRRYQARHKGEPALLERQKAALEKFHAAHPDYQRERSLRNVEEKRKYSRDYYQRNRDAINERRRAKRQAAKANN